MAGQPDTISGTEAELDVSSRGSVDDKKIQRRVFLRDECSVAVFTGLKETLTADVPGNEMAPVRLLKFCVP